MTTTFHWDYGVEVTDLLTDLPGYWVFTDGGIIGRNNADSIGITGAAIGFCDGAETFMHTWVGVEGHESYTSNHAEVWAAMVGVSDMRNRVAFPIGINLVLDSGVTFTRIQNLLLNIEQPWTGECVEDIERYEEAFLPNGSYLERVVLVSGHPSKKTLKEFPNHLCNWFEDKSRVWYRHNVECDRLCNEEKSIFLGGG